MFNNHSFIRKHIGGEHLAKRKAPGIAGIARKKRIVSGKNFM